MVLGLLPEESNIVLVTQVAWPFLVKSDRVVISGIENFQSREKFHRFGREQMQV